ncbi:MAG: HupE/UreJ family protein [Pseudomonadota bacterium]
MLLSTLAFAGSAAAHTLGEGYLFINVSDDSLDGRYEITLTDLNKAVPVDTDQDGKVVEAEVDAAIDQIKAYFGERLGIGDGEREYALNFTHHKLTRIPVGQFLELHYTTAWEGRVPDVLHLRYDVLFERDDTHRGFLVIGRNDKTGVVNTGEDTTLRFGPDSTQQSVDFTALDRAGTFFTFVKHGIWHIWIGIDHILFLVALILPAVMVRRDGQWHPVADYGPAVWNVVKVVTLFTLAHTVTLTLAALDVVSLPARVVESVIAASVIAAALNNIVPIFRGHVGWVVFGFGLFHGFGFASVLSHLITNRSNLIVDLLGFNVGVELGQIAIVLVAFPILVALRNTVFYRRMLLPVGSAVIMLLAAGWLVERMFDLELMPI